VAGGHRGRSEANIELAATPGNDSLVIEAQSQSAKSHFDAGIRFIVSDKEIGDAEGEWIERAASRNAKLAESSSARVLHSR
jgi:hypothetical protein